MPVIVHIAASPTSATPFLENKVHDLKLALRESGIIVLEWLSDDVPVDVLYERDLGNVHASTLLVALVDEQSIGVGLEIAEAMRTEKPILCLHGRNVQAPLLLRSATAHNKRMRIAAYESIAEAAALVRTFIGSSRSMIPA